MARYPGAIWRPITGHPRYARTPLNIYNRVNLHVAVSEASSLFGAFNQSGVPFSHFYVRRDGTVEQYQDTRYRAAADLDGNDATISVETQGGVNNANGEPWTPQQLESLAQIFAWAVKTHRIANQMATSSRTDTSSRGLSWHRLGINGNFPSLPSILAGRIQRGGGMRYSSARGKLCPGDAKINQIPSIFNRAQEVLGGAPVAPTPTPPAPTPPPRVNYNPAGFGARYVRDIQTRLNRVGYKLAVDGKLGPLTFNAIKDYQRKNNLVVDGIPGQATLASLRAKTDVAPTAPSYRDVRPLQGAVRAVQDNVVGPDTRRRINAVKESGNFFGNDFPYGVRFTQRVVGTTADGKWGPNSRAAHDSTVLQIQRIVGVTRDGRYGPITDAAVQRYLSEGRNV